MYGKDQPGGTKNLSCDNRTDNDNLCSRPTYTPKQISQIKHNTKGYESHLTESKPVGYLRLSVVKYYRAENPVSGREAGLELGNLVW